MEGPSRIKRTRSVKNARLPTSRNIVVQTSGRKIKQRLYARWLYAGEERTKTTVNLRLVKKKTNYIDLIKQKRFIRKNVHNRQFKIIRF